MKALTLLLGILLVAVVVSLLAISWLERSKIREKENLIVVEKNDLTEIWAGKKAQQDRIDSLQVEMDNLPDSLQVSKTGIIINNSKAIAKAMQRLEGQEMSHKRSLKTLRADRDELRRRLTLWQTWLGIGAVLLAVAVRVTRQRFADP